MEKDVGILMADLSGYTAMTDVHGGATAAKLVTKYIELVNISICGNCEVTQRIGDQIVVISEKATDLAATIEKLKRSIIEESHFLSIHAGLHFGPIHREGDSLFGSTINVTSRIMNLAQRGQVLCSSSFVNAIGESAFSFSPVGRFKFKNVLKDVEIFELGVSANSSVPVDPVCHMNISTESRFMLEWSGKTYHFCSEQCKNIFEGDPLAFVRE
jgi:class 3 adenylate cyclase/YHS domain-containing protein